jgi:serine/threonine-protein kinase
MAAHLSGAPALVSPLVFDDVGGRWLAVGLGSQPCNNAPAEYWMVYTLQPGPDGSLAGETSATTGSACGDKRTVTFTRTGDVDVNTVPDPASLPPRVVSPAEALHGRYHETNTYPNGETMQDDVAGRTDCLRTGDRCISFFHSPRAADPLVFGTGSWSVDREFDEQCRGAGGTAHMKVTQQYPLPAPPQDPITLLTGHGHQEQTGSCALSTDSDIKLERTGD